MNTINQGASSGEGRGLGQFDPWDALENVLREICPPPPDEDDCDCDWFEDDEQ